MEDVNNGLNGLPVWLVFVLNAGALSFNRYGDYLEEIMGVFYGLTNFALTIGALVVMSFKMYEYYKKYIKK